MALSVMAMLLIGIVTYGLWLTAASGLQQVANEAARATLGALSEEERDQLARRAIQRGLQPMRIIDTAKVHIDTRMQDGFYTVTLSYDSSSDALFGRSIVPLPTENIVRGASVEVSGW